MDSRTIIWYVPYSNTQKDPSPFSTTLMISHMPRLQGLHCNRRIQGILGVAFMLVMLQKLPLRRYQSSRTILMGIPPLMENSTPSRCSCLSISTLSVFQSRFVMSSGKRKWAVQPSQTTPVIKRYGSRKDVIKNPLRTRRPRPSTNQKKMMIPGQYLVTSHSR